MTAIETRDLTKSFGPVQAVHNLNLNITRGEIFGFFGPNGSGKTTTVRLLNGILTPTSGSARILGSDSQDETVRFKTATMSENALMYEGMSVYDNLVYFGRLYLMEDSECRRRIESLLRELDLWEKRDDKLGSFSTGMKKKVYLIRTLVHNPEIIFLDEPASGLDPEAAVQVIDLIHFLAKHHGTTVLLCTHNLKAVERICDSVAFIDEGRLLAAGNKADIISTAAPEKKITITASAEEYTFSNPEEINMHLERLIRQHKKIEDVSIHSPTIEDAYFHFIGGKKNSEKTNYICHHGKGY